MPEKTAIVPLGKIEQRILLIRGEKVIVDADLAEFYGVPTKRLNEQVKRNKGRFPDDFMFQLSPDEKAEVVANCDHLENLKYSTAVPYAFTEHGAIMAAGMLNTSRAIEISVFIVRAFIKMRQMVAGHKDFQRKISQIERRLTDHDEQIIEERNIMKKKWVFILLAIFLSYASNVGADKAILAGGCFWCMESDFEKLDGVTDVISGFTGGTLINPTYNGNHEGHYEAVEITYDPDKVSYKELLDHYWVNIDPFDAEGQFCDKGSSYLSAIFVANETEKKIAEESKRKVEAQFPDKTVVTPILNASTFYPIKGDESYHQDFYKNSPIRYKAYRWNCGRDKRLKEIWGDKAKH